MIAVRQCPSALDHTCRRVDDLRFFERHKDSDRFVKVALDPQLVVPARVHPDEGLTPIKLRGMSCRWRLCKNVKK